MPRRCPVLGIGGLALTFLFLLIRLLPALLQPMTWGDFTAEPAAN